MSLRSGKPTPRASSDVSSAFNNEKASKKSTKTQGTAPKAPTRHGGASSSAAPQAQPEVSQDNKPQGQVGIGSGPGPGSGQEDQKKTPKFEREDPSDVEDMGAEGKLPMRQQHEEPRVQRDEVEGGSKSETPPRRGALEAQVTPGPHWSAQLQALVVGGDASATLGAVLHDMEKSLQALLSGQDETRGDFDDIGKRLQIMKVLIDAAFAKAE